MSIAGISFYDFLAKLAPGLLLLGLVISPDSFNELVTLQFIAVLVGAYLLGILYDLGVRAVFPFLRRNSWMLKRSKEKISQKNTRLSSDNKNNDKFCIQHLYDEAYTCLLMHGTLYNIPILEAHENFLKNIWIIVILYFLRFMSLTESLGAWGLNTCQLSSLRLVLFVCIILIPLVWYNIQMQVFQSVWNNAAWTKEVLTHNSLHQSKED